VEGSFRFLKRVWAYCLKFEAGSKTDVKEHLRKATRFEIHSQLRQINYDMQKHQFNTVASGAMKILNALERLEGVPPEAKEGLGILLRILSPITPHLAHHLWRELGFGDDVLRAPWPEPAKEALEQDEIEYVVQINGVKRGSVRAPKAADKTALEVLVTSLDFVKKYLGEKIIKRIVIVPGRLINIVV
jgi:leucyl-tRNA synthetase